MKDLYPAFGAAIVDIAMTIMRTIEAVKNRSVSKAALVEAGNMRILLTKYCRLVGGSEHDNNPIIRALQTIPCTHKLCTP